MSQALIGTDAPAREAGTEVALVAVVGLGYVGLPTSLALAGAGFAVVGIDVSDRRLRAIRSGDVDLIPDDCARLTEALANPRVEFTSDHGALTEADAVLVCVPTPIDGERQPELSALRSACAAVVAAARPGQVVILTSTSHVGATRELLVDRLSLRGLIAGDNISVAFSPERIDPGNTRSPQRGVPRVVGGATPSCSVAAAVVMGEIAADTVIVSSAETAELAKLLENTFRAVNIALANEIAEIALAHGLEPIEVVEAAATKPYGFMPFYPGPGAGGHCIPCDPHYLLEPLERIGARAPLVTGAMKALHERPAMFVERALAMLAADRIRPKQARVLVVGVAYKPGVADVRESPGHEILSSLRKVGVRVDYHDPLVPRVQSGDGEWLTSSSNPAASEYDLVIVTLPLGDACVWIDECERVLDCTYRIPHARVSAVR